MRHFYILLITVFLISCNTNTVKTATEKNPDNYERGMKVLNTNDETGKVDYVKALDYFEKSVKENPDHVESKYWKMQCELQTGKLDDALETSKSVLSVTKNLSHNLIPDFLVTAGLIEKINGNINESAKYFVTAIEIYNIRIAKNTDDIVAIMEKAVIMCYLDKKDEAMKFLESVSVSEDTQALLDDAKLQMADFDVDTVINKLTKNKE